MDKIDTTVEKLEKVLKNVETNSIPEIEEQLEDL
jgi:hypothetical protein